MAPGAGVAAISTAMGAAGDYPSGARRRYPGAARVFFASNGFVNADGRQCPLWVPAVHAV